MLSNLYQFHARNVPAPDRMPQATYKMRWFEHQCRTLPINTPTLTGKVISDGETRFTITFQYPVASIRNVPIHLTRQNGEEDGYVSMVEPGIASKTSVYFDRCTEWHMGTALGYDSTYSYDGNTYYSGKAVYSKLRCTKYEDGVEISHTDYDLTQAFGSYEAAPSLATLPEEDIQARAEDFISFVDIEDYTVINNVIEINTLMCPLP